MYKKVIKVKANCKIIVYTAHSSYPHFGLTIVAYLANLYFA